MAVDWTAVIAVATAAGLAIDKIRDALAKRAEVVEEQSGNLFKRAEGVVDSQAKQIERLEAAQQRDAARINELTERVDHLEEQLSVHRRLLREAGIEPPPLTAARSA